MLEKMYTALMHVFMKRKKKKKPHNCNYNHLPTEGAKLLNMKYSCL